MAGFLRRSALYLGLVDDEEQDYYDDEYDTSRGEGDGERETGAATAVRSRRSSAATATAMAPPMTAVRDEPRPASRSSVGDAYRITTLTPRTYNEARTIGEHFRDGVPVIINLTEMVDADAKRLVDFAAGLIFGLHGSIERVTNKVFLLSPSNVEVSAEDKARIAESGFFNQS